MKPYIEPEEVTLMEKVASYLRNRLLIRLLARLGCRISETLALEVKDIDFAQGTVTIEFLKGNGPEDSKQIDPDIGAPMTDIHFEYESALH